MCTNDWTDEKAFLQALEKRSIKAFMQLYKEYGEDVLIFAYIQLQDSERAVQIVDRLFEHLWVDTNFEDIGQPIHKYLLQELHKLCEEQLPNN